MPKTKAEELEDKIKTLEEIGESEAAEKYKAELAKIKGKEKEPMAEKESKGLVAPATREEYEVSASKFITIPAGKTFVEREIEMSIPRWETAGHSYQFPTTVVEEGIDYGKTEKIVSGATGGEKGGIWKTKQIYFAVTGHDMPMVKGADGVEHPTVIPDEIAGQRALGHWDLAKDSRTPEEGGKGTVYSKLTNILPLGSEVEDLGI